MSILNKKELSGALGEELLNALKIRFKKNSHRHPGITWAEVEARLEANPARWEALGQMEATGGEPDVVGQNRETGEYIFFDTSAESPAGRRSLCYDGEALDSRKEHKPAGSALEMAAAMGIKLLTETQYRELQQLGPFDAKTSSWIQTPAAIRKLGGALLADFRYGQVFMYHNGAPSCYAARGYRGAPWV